MNKDAFLEYLRNSKYKFNAHGDNIEVRIGFSQLAIVDFTHDRQPEITDRMIPWNFLTGLIPMKFKSAFVYNVIMCLLLAVVFVLLWPTAANVLFTVMYVSVISLISAAIYIHYRKLIDFRKYTAEFFSSPYVHSQ